MQFVVIEARIVLVTEDVNSHPVNFTYTYSDDIYLVRYHINQVPFNSTPFSRPELLTSILTSLHGSGGISAWQGAAP